MDNFISNLVVILSSLATIFGTLFIFVATLTEFQVNNLEKEMNSLLEELSDRCVKYSQLNYEKLNKYYTERFFDLTILLNKYEDDWQKRNSFYVSMQKRYNYERIIAICTLAFVFGSILALVFMKVSQRELLALIVFVMFPFSYIVYDGFIIPFIGFFIKTSVSNNYLSTAELLNPSNIFVSDKLKILKNMPIRLFAAMNVIHCIDVDNHEFAPYEYKVQLNGKDPGDERSIIMFEIGRKINFEGDLIITDKNNRNESLHINQNDIGVHFGSKIGFFLTKTCLKDIKSIRLEVKNNYDKGGSSVLYVESENENVWQAYFSGGYGSIKAQPYQTVPWKRFLTQQE